MSLSDDEFDKTPGALHNSYEDFDDQLITHSPSIKSAVNRMSATCSTQSYDLRMLAEVLEYHSILCRFEDRDGEILYVAVPTDMFSRQEGREVSENSTRNEESHLRRAKSVDYSIRVAHVFQETLTHPTFVFAKGVVVMWDLDSKDQAFSRSLEEDFHFFMRKFAKGYLVMEQQRAQYDYSEPQKEFPNIENSSLNTQKTTDESMSRSRFSRNPETFSNVRIHSKGKKARRPQRKAFKRKPVFQRPSFINLKTSSLKEKLAVSFAIYESVVLDTYSAAFDELAEKFRPRDQGTAPVEELQGLEVIKTLAAIYVKAIDVNIINAISETPDVLWEDDTFESHWGRCHKALQIDERLQVLKHRMNVLQEALFTLNDGRLTSSEFRLTWAIIFLLCLLIILKVVKEFLETPMFHWEQIPIGF